MANCESTAELVALQMELIAQCQGELPVLATSIANRVAVQDVDIRNKIQENLNHATGCLTVVYVFALLEHHDFVIGNKWLSNDEKTILKAWKHVRHSAAHGFSGRRAQRYRTEFDSIMISQYPLPCVEDWDNNNLKVNSLIGFQLLQFVRDLVPNLVARSAT